MYTLIPILSIVQHFNAWVLSKQLAICTLKRKFSCLWPSLVYSYPNNKKCYARQSLLKTFKGSVEVQTLMQLIRLSVSDSSKGHYCPRHWNLEGTIGPSLATSFCRRKWDLFQGLKGDTCLILGNELSKETRVMTKQETLLGRGTLVGNRRVREPRKTARPRGTQHWVLRWPG